ncbi:MAG: AAA family ATPase [Fibrobacteraceae bacterium]|nr:AAA family ATPase [Fibrobacteraceae bacterium]
MILDKESLYYKQVCNTECFNKSLLRDTNIDDYSLVKGKEMLREEGRQYALRKKEISFKYESCEDEISLSFSPLNIMANDGENDIFPNGMVAFIGKNGSGKSTLLYRLATELYTSANNRTIDIAPKDIVVSQLMLFSYSPFDDFVLPIQKDELALKDWYEKNLKFKETQNDAYKPRFIYCGLRNVENEVKSLVDSYKENEKFEVENRIKKQIPQNIEKISDECRKAFVKALRQDDWNDFIDDVNKEIPELATSLNEMKSASIFNENEWYMLFKKLSTGHKFFLHAMSHLIAYGEENAIVMFDEPENHLQPPLLSFMMKKIRKVLVKRSSVMLVATHSPVILQEILSSNVRVICRNGDRLLIKKPSIETYGASFGAISSEVFGLSSDKVSYFDVLKTVFEQKQCVNMKTVKEVIDCIEEYLGDISDVAIRYVVQLYLKASQGDENVAHS